MVDPIIFILITGLGATLGLKVTTTQNPVYSGLYLVLVFFLGSGIAFLLGLEFMGLLFLLVYAGAIAVLVLFVVMMLDVKAIENPWSAKKKRMLYLIGLVFLFFLIGVVWSEGLRDSIGLSIGSLVLFGLGDAVDGWPALCYDNEGLDIPSSGTYNKLFVDFDISCALNDPSYLLYSTYAILLIIGGVILLIAMVGAITLTLQKNCPEFLYRQLGRESKNAVFSIKERPAHRSLPDSEV